MSPRILTSESIPRPFCHTAGKDSVDVLQFALPSIQVSKPLTLVVFHSRSRLALCTPSKAKMSARKFPLESLPPELLDHVCSYLPQKRLYALVHTSKALSEAAAINLYHNPKFASSYRLAQFVTTVSHSRHHAEMVRKFGLWDNTLVKDQSDELASWMEWKYRSVPLYAARTPEQTTKLTKDVKKRVIHPRSNQFLSKSELNKGINTGAIVHVLAACRNLR